MCALTLTLHIFGVWIPLYCGNRFSLTWFLHKNRAIQRYRLGLVFWGTLEIVYTLVHCSVEPFVYVCRVSCVNLVFTSKPIWFSEVFPPLFSIVKDILQWNPQADRKIGKPRETWWRSVNKEVGRVGKAWYEVRRIAIERTDWNILVATLCSK